jgi:1-aminocyclopropane-1-carboxylate deaminase/D-cysteine desulfhydrase-like pyridoxal-dependent ACC family enzyme
MNPTNINIQLDEINSDLLKSRQIELFIARLDLIHPVVSGNKLFKLYYFIEEAIRENKNTIVTMGGAYSNHLVATAFYCIEAGLKSIGIVRGEMPTIKSHTLNACESYGMKLIYISRSDYNKKNEDLISELTKENSEEIYFIPEGGYHPLGAKGASLIMKQIKETDASHICTAVGTATTLSGLILNTKPNQQIIAVPVLKGINDLVSRLNFLTNNIDHHQLCIFDEYHFGGYAKKDETLIQFMNDFYTEYNVPTDFVYTGKMMYAIFDKIKSNFFPLGSKIICIHTGGLQGNLSLPNGSLVF